MLSCGRVLWPIQGCFSFVYKNKILNRQPRATLITIIITISTPTSHVTVYVLMPCSVL